MRSERWNEQLPLMRKPYLHDAIFEIQQERHFGFLVGRSTVITTATTTTKSFSYLSFYDCFDSFFLGNCFELLFSYDVFHFFLVLITSLGGLVGILFFLSCYVTWKESFYFYQVLRTSEFYVIELKCKPYWLLKNEDKL